MGRGLKIAVSFMLALMAACASGGDREPVTAFVGVTLIAAYGEPHRLNQTVLVRGDRIVAVGEASEIDVPRGARVLGRPGQYLAPGLVDMHVHLFEASDAVLFLANGVTSVRDMRGRPEVDALAARIAAGEAPGPTIYASTPILNGPREGNDNTYAIRSAGEMRARVDDVIARRPGYVGVKLYEDLSRDAYVAGVEAAHAYGLLAWGHVPNAMSVDEVLAARLDGIEHLIGFDRALAPHSTSTWEEERWAQAEAALMPGLARRVAESGVWVDPTLVIFVDTPHAFADLDAARAAPEYRFATPHQRMRWRQALETIADPQANWAMTQRGHEARLAMVRALHEVGAPLLMGTDAPQPYVYAGFSLHREFELHRDAGLTPAEILRADTADAARFLRREGEFGVITVGARADVLLLDGNPEADMDVLRAPAGVMAAGRWYDAAALRQMLDDIAADIRRRLAQ